MKKSSLLWRIEGPGLTAPSYIFGTMHMIEKEYYFFPEKVEKLLLETEELVMELPGLPSREESMELLTLKEGSFFDYFTKEQSDSLYQWASKNLSMREALFRKTMDSMKPFVFVQLATQLNFIGKMEYYEQAFESLAQTNKIPISGLETVADQMLIFDNLSKAQQTEMVMESIRNPEKVMQQTREMEQLYVDQNVDQLYINIIKAESVIVDEQSAFLDNRNSRWIPLIIQHMKLHPTFVAVGAGHLGGPNGVVRLLQREGYTLTPIRIK
ncbi:MAG: hypothetical protein RL632_736 [Bacteroidota bacterium]|jgi:uncharacterized protein YbaP (TraB family)